MADAASIATEILLHSSSQIAGTVAAFDYCIMMSSLSVIATLFAQIAFFACLFCTFCVVWYTVLGVVL